MGRPIEYTEEVQARAEEYLESYSEVGDVVPSLAGLARYLNIARSTLYLWSKDKNKPLFSDIVEEVSDEQHRCLINGGLLGTFNAPIAKVMMTKHGYSDKQEIEHAGSVNQSSYTPEQYAKAQADMKDKGLD